MTYNDLTQEQKWGFEFAAMLANQRDQTSLTGEEYALQRLRKIGTDLYEELKSHKWSIAKQMFDAAPPEQQAIILAQFGVPDVLQ